MEKIIIHNHQNIPKKDIKVGIYDIMFNLRGELHRHD